MTEAPNKPAQGNSSQPVFFSGPCHVDGPVGDSKFGVMTMDHPLLYRDVEVYCWTEKSEDVETRHGSQVRRGKKYHYKTEWVTNYVDSKYFKDQKYNQNVHPDVSSECFQGGQVRVGTYYSVDLNAVKNAFGLHQLTNLFQHGKLTAEFDKNGIWSHCS